MATPCIPPILPPTSEELALVVAVCAAVAVLAIVVALRGLDGLPPLLLQLLRSVVPVRQNPLLVMGKINHPVADIASGDKDSFSNDVEGD